MTKLQKEKAPVIFTRAGHDALGQELLPVTSRLNGLGLASDADRSKPGGLEGSARVVMNCGHAFPFCQIRWVTDARLVKRIAPWRHALELVRRGFYAAK
jgi:hypothetical protein